MGYTPVSARLHTNICEVLFLHPLSLPVWMCKASSERRVLKDIERFETNSKCESLEKSEEI